MRKIDKSSQFKRDIAKVRHSGKYAFEEIEKAMFLLATDAPLPERFRDHALQGKWKLVNARDCHVYPDLVLVYYKQPGRLQLLRLTSHSDLF